MGLFENPNTWGTSAWIFLHCVSCTFPEKPTLKEKKNYDKFFRSLENILPCKLCRTSYKDYILLHPPIDSMESRKTMMDWVIDMHNHVNKKLGRPVLSKKKARLEIQNLCDLKRQDTTFK